ncbi:unnamed protein product [Bemisia tabaci]|uniref:Afadin n=1 Tax=Bemisia tabaci TaxID=7038 RepID=A0A9P0G5T4_BEMTA|nr:PREDICTED: afadin [Bemisia tabaci]CAH0775210.1 unnamed protein product [Bemisia tabaci]
MNPEMAMVARRNEEVETLRGVIQQWNANRLDLFELSEPNEYLVFHGVMRFYFQDSGQKVATKCIRVASDATSQDVIETLIEKFRPDMRMLSVPEYALYEIHENGGSSGSKYHERRLDVTEKPLLVQLNWHKDDREGRFLLRRIDDTTNVPAGTFQESGSSFRRKLSKREKKQLKKQEKLNRVKSTGSSTTVTDENDSGVAEKLYTELPETSFTRSISNPEAVMRRRRQQKLERKLQQFRSKDGGPDTGGTLRIYGESLCKDVPYKTLLLSVRDSAAAVVREMLAKYGLDKEDPHNYCLVQVNNAIPLENSTNTNGASVPGENNNNREYILDDDECPLAILMNHPQSRGSIMFHVRRRPADYHPRKRKKKPQQKWNHHSPNNELLDYRYEDAFDRLPFFLELNPDGSDIANGTPKRHKLHPNVTEVGNERASPHSQSQFLQLFGPNIQPRHCVIAHTEGIVTVTPCSRDAETYVNGQRIYETTILHNGAIVKFGRIHNFRFLDPCYEERTRQRLDSSRSIHDYSYDRQSSREDTSSIASPDNRSASVQNLDTPTSNPPHNSTAQNYETTFDIDGNVETRSTSSQGNKDDNRSQRSVSSSREGNRLSNNYDRYPRGSDAILPAVLEIREETEEALLHALITYFEPTSPNFILAPAYTLYLVARFRASTHYRPELTPTERAHKLTLMLAKVAAMIHNIIQEQYCDVKSLALWLANSSELLHFLKMDRHISAFSLEAQDTLSDAVQISFRHLVSCLQNELATALPNFLLDHDDLNHESDDSATSSVLSILASAMALQRRCRVNAALTIQLFSQLFHYINVWLFNRIVAPNSTYCTRVWGARLKHRLGQIEIWAERQGLELAANCHLALIKQAAHLLQAPKYTAEDLSTLSPACFKLNSLQLRALFQKYQPTPYEGRLPHDLIDNVVRVAENLADELARSDGREVKLEEDADLLNTTFLVPDEGYTCEVIRGVPPGLIETLAPFQHAGLCRLSAQPASNGLWTVYMNVNPMQGSMARSPSAMSNRSGRFMPTQQEPDIQIIKLHKSNNGMGLSIVAAKGAGQDRLGIYIKSVVKGGAADADGRLQAGDQLLKVDGQSLVGITQEKAAEYLVKTGPTVTLEVAKQGAIYYGLATLLSQPSPVMSRAGPRRMSERDLPSRVLTEQSQNTRGQLPPHVPQIHSSKSVPSLHSANNEVPPIPRSNQEAFNQGYTRTSSTNSIPQSRTLRSRSSQNLNDSRSMNNAYPQGHPPNNVGMPHHQQLTPNYPPVHSPQQQYTPNYPHSPPHPVGHPPNHPMNHSGHYGGHMPGHPQQQYTPNYPQNPAGTPQGHTPNYPHSPPGPPPQQYSASIYAQSPPAHPPSHLSAQHSLNQSSQENGERFYQNLSVYRNQEIRQNGYIPQNTSLNQTASSISSPGNNVHGNLPSPTKNKYTASNADPPRGYYHPSSPGNQQPRQYQFQGTNPWEREEREKEQLRKREAARAWRDQQIAKLLSLGPHRSQSQEEQLKALKLEKEFERRAQEEEDEEDDQESAERAQGLLRLAQQQDEKRNNTANSTMSGRLQPQQNSNHAHLNGTLSRPTILPNLPVPQYNYNGYSSNQNSPAGDKVQTPSQRLDILHLSPSQPPQPPERGSSFAVMSQSVSALRSPPSQTLNNPHPPPVQNNRNETPTTKRVSFQETTTTLSSPAESISPPPPPPISEKVREDPNHFIDEAETLLASPKSPDTSFTGSTPGVIGAQEVYKDPRQRRLAEQQHQKLMSNRTSTVPEKLSFKEKMKMFAMETGENGTPRDKVKISKAQREIDNLGSGLTPTSNNSTTPVAATNGSST